MEKFSYFKSLILRDGLLGEMKTFLTDNIFANKKFEIN